jgi:hypothetical protein
MRFLSLVVLVMPLTSFRATSPATAGQVALLMDDSGGAGGGYTQFQFGGVDHLVGGYFSIVEDNFNFVVDGHRAPVDWAVSTPISAPAPGPLADEQTIATFFDPQFVSWRVTQETYAYATAPHDQYVIVRYRLLNTWGGGTISQIYPTVWFDFDANGTATDACAYDAANFLAYQFDANQRYVGVALLSGTPHAVRFTTGGVSPLPGTDGAEEAAIVAGGISPSVTNANAATGMAMGPYNVATGSSVEFAVAVVAGNTLADCQAAAAAARQKFATFGTPPIPTPTTKGRPKREGCTASAGGVSVLAGIVVLVALLLLLARKS